MTAVKPRACVVVASEMTARTFLLPQLRAMQARYDLTLVVNTANANLLGELGVSGTTEPVRIARPISPAADLRALVALFRLMRARRFDLVHSLTPKAGLLAMVAARLARVPVRIHTFTGQVWATRTGVSRQVLRLMDRLIARCATATLADSPAQRAFLVAERIVEPERIGVVGNGPVGGIDADRFRPDPERRRATRERLGLASDDTIVLFMGRLRRDKGVLELARAFAAIARDHRDVHALVVGPDEEQLRATLIDTCSDGRDRLHFVDFTDAPEAFMAAADVLCLPSYREGCGVVTLEGAAAGLPIVASRIYGLVDAVEEGRTGLLHEAGDAAGLESCLRALITDPVRRRAFGTAGRAKAIRDYSPSRVTAELIDFYGREERRAAHSVDSPAPGGRGWYRRFGKRALDLCVVVGALPVVLPVSVMVAIAVRCVLGAPVLFRQQRPGLHGVPFQLIKFRTMAEAHTASGGQLGDEGRLTAFGRWLRACSLDELPELWNVLRGDMSLVGPRPLLMAYLDRYTAEQARRHDVRPGMTGLAQVNGRNALPWDDRFELDLEYVARCSPGLDLKILALTLREVIARRGISQPGQATSEEFMGTAGR